VCPKETQTVHSAFSFSFRDQKWTSAVTET